MAPKCIKSHLANLPYVPPPKPPVTAALAVRLPVEQVLQSPGVPDRIGVAIVVEVDEHVFASHAPLPGSLSPPHQVSIGTCRP